MAIEPNRPRFGINIHPGAGHEDEAFARARIAEEHDLDLISLMDHPYNPDLYDTWTLLTSLAARTERVHLLTNVLNTLLRPPAMLAKAAAALDRLSDGRLELGVGAGAYLDGVVAFGGPTGSPGELYQRFKETLDILRGLWNSNGEPFSYDGSIYHLTNASFGPAPTRPIPIWIGAGGRIRTRPGLITGNAAHWIETILSFVRDSRMDTFTFWPVAGAELRQIEVFAKEVVPAVRLFLST